MSRPRPEITTPHRMPLRNIIEHNTIRVTLYVLLLTFRAPGAYTIDPLAFMLFQSWENHAEWGSGPYRGGEEGWGLSKMTRDSPCEGSQPPLWRSPPSSIAQESWGAAKRVEGAQEGATKFLEGIEEIHGCWVGWGGPKRVEGTRGDLWRSKRVEGG